MDPETYYIVTFVCDGTRFSVGVVREEEVRDAFCDTLVSSTRF